MKRNSEKIKLAVLFIFLLNFSRASAQHDTSNQHLEYPTQTQPKYTGIDKENDAKFLNEAFQSNNEEIQMTLLAEKKSSDNDLKKVAVNLKSDHQQLNNELNELAKRKSIAINPPDTLKMNYDMSSLMKLKGNDFNKTWIEMMLKNHQQTLTKLQQAESSASDNDLRSWIKNTIPKVENHIAQLTALKSKTK